VGSDDKHDVQTLCKLFAQTGQLINPGAILTLGNLRAQPLVGHFL